MAKNVHKYRGALIHIYESEEDNTYYAVFHHTLWVHKEGPQLRWYKTIHKYADYDTCLKHTKMAVKGILKGFNLWSCGVERMKTGGG